MGYTRVLTIATDDFTQLKAVSDLNDQTWAVPDFLTQLVVDPTKIRFRKILLEAKDTGAQVFFIFADAATTARLMEQGYYLGVFHENTIIFGGYENSGPAIFKYFTPGAPVEQIMKGYFGIERIPNYSVTNTLIGQQFIAAWQSQTATYSPQGYCSNATDLEGNSLLQRNVSGSIQCAGYNFSTFNASMFLPAAPHTYDAVYAAAYGLHSLLYNAGRPNITTDALGTELKVNVSFYGTTGLIEFDSVTTHIYLLLKLNV
jgi:hypothetical protein